VREEEHGQNLPAGFHTIEMSCPRTDLGFTRDRHFKPRRSATADLRWASSTLRNRVGNLKRRGLLDHPLARMMTAVQAP
jgi:hypothetical protein